jgi:hypothetical protein
MPDMFWVSKDILRTAEVTMSRSKYVVLLIVLTALVIALLGGVFEVDVSSSGLESVSGLHW